MSDFTELTVLGPRPSIETNNRQLINTVQDCWDGIRARISKTPDLFLRGGQLVRVRVDDEEGPRIERLQQDLMRGYLTRKCDFVATTGKGASSNVHPPLDVANDMVLNPVPWLPRLEIVTTTPSFTASGKLAAAPGYCAEARLWYAGTPLRTELPEHPTSVQIEEARALLAEELFGDFPFTEDSDLTHAVGAMLLGIVRPMVAGPTPIHLFDSPSPGTGKGLACDVISIALLGTPCPPITMSSDDNENRKRITGMLSRGPSVLLLDNIPSGLTLDSASLASAITSEVWSDRLLGRSQIIDLPNRATWLMTANNPRLSLEVARRCVRARLDAKQDRPWLRSKFRHADLRQWAQELRPMLLRALITLVRGWLDAGRPAPPRKLGSFESWSNVVGGILEFSGLQGFCSQLEKLYEEADPEGQEWREFVAAWHDAFKLEWVVTSQLFAVAKRQSLLGSVLAGDSDRSQMTRLGNALGQMRDRCFNDLRVVSRENSHRKSKEYRLESTVLSVVDMRDRGTSRDLFHSEPGLKNESSQGMPMGKVP